MLFSFASNYVGAVAAFASTVILSRLLTPEQIGVFAVAAAVSALAHTVRDMGLGEYIVQTRDLTPEKFRAAFTVTLTLSWAMGLAMFLGSWEIGRFYRHEGAGQVARVLALNFFLVPFGAIAMSYFQRQLNFFPSFLTTIIGMPVAVCVSVGLALLGWGYMSLAWSSVAAMVVTVAVSVWMRPPEVPWLPGLKGCREMLHFGKHIFFFSAANQAGKSAPDIIVGRMIDLTAVGYFSRAGGLAEIVNRTVLRAISPVCLPYFASHVHSGADVKAGYLKAVTFITVIAWPFYGFLGITSYAAIRLLYGDQWLAAVPYARVLCLAAAIEVTYSFINELLVSTGNVAKNSQFVLALQCVRTGVVLAAAPLGLTAVAWAMVSAAVMGGILSQRTLRRMIGLHASEFARALRKNLIITAAALIPPLIAEAAIGATPGNYVLFFFATGAASALSWLLAVRLCGHPIWPEILRSQGALLSRVKSWRNK